MLLFICYTERRIKGVCCQLKVREENERTPSEESEAPLGLFLYSVMAIIGITKIQ